MAETKLKKQALQEDIWHYVGNPGEPAFQNGWSNFNTGADPSLWGYVSFRKDADGYVHLRGLAKSGAGGTVFTLPVGYRPAASQIFAVSTNSGFGSWDVMTTGVINARITNSDWTSLDGIVFKAEA